MTTHQDIFSFRRDGDERVVPLREYLKAFNSPNETFGDNVAGALVRAVGKAKVVNTAKDERLGRMYSNRVIEIFPAFEDFYGMEDQILRAMKFFRKAAAGYPEEKMMPYAHGLPSSGKTSFVERILRCFERAELWTLAIPGKVKDADGKEVDGYVTGPIGEHPFGLFNLHEHGAYFEKFYQISRGRLQTGMSPWAAYWLQRLGSRDKFFVKKMRPWGATSTCIATADFGAKKDTNFLIGQGGKGLRRRDYIYSGAFNKTTQGILELVELFKADPKLLLSLLTATQDRWYVGDGGIGRLPYQGLLLAYSNTDDWKLFRELPAVSGLMSRVFEIPVPLPTSVSAEAKILRKVIQESGDSDMPIAPGSLRVASVLTVASRLDKAHRGLRLRLYDGQHPGNFAQDLPEWSEKDKLKVTADDLRRRAEYKEGMEYGLFLRQIMKWLAELADSDPNGTQELAAARAKANRTQDQDKDDSSLGENEVGLDPVSLIKKLIVITERECKKTLDDGTRVRDLIEQYCVQEAERIISLLVRRAHPDDYNWYLRDRFGRYFELLDAWIEDREYKDPNSGRDYSVKELGEELMKLESHLDIKEPVKDFRARICEKVHPHRDEFLKPGGTPWKNIDPDLWRKIEEVLLPSRDTMLPSEGAMNDDKTLWSVDFRVYRETKEKQERHARFVKRFIDLCTDPAEGTRCTPWQAQRMIQWWVGGCVFKDLLS